MGTPSRLKRPPPQTEAPVLERIDELGMTENLKTYKHLLISYTSISTLFSRIPPMKSNQSGLRDDDGQGKHWILSQ